MTEDAPPPAETPPMPSEGVAVPAAQPHPLRWASILGSAAAAVLCAAWVLPWILVDDDVARDFHATVTREIESRGGPSAGTEEFLRIAETMRAEGGLRGTDFIQWLRAGQTFSNELDAEVNPGVQAEAHLRRLRLVQYLLYGIPLAAFLLLAHFLMHRFRRARAPVLILAILTGLAAMLTAAVLDYTQGFISDAIRAGGADLGWGWRALLWGGVGLAVAGVFGVRRRNWFRVYMISAAMAAAIGVLAVRYLETGGLP